MTSHIRTKPAAENRISTRRELVSTLGCTADFVAKVTSDPNHFYTEFKIPKRNGELRSIKPPCEALRLVQRSLLTTVYKRVQFPPWMHGGIPRRSIFSHARAHVGRQMVFTLDVAGFFPSTSARHVQPVLSTIGIGGQAAEDIKSLIMLDNGLPQGAPTSSVFANLAFAPADTLFFEFCRRQLLFYTRYVDDIAISGDRAFTELKGTFIQFIESSGYSIAARDKINPMLSARRQIVTGLVVNDKLRPTREFLADLKHEIRLCLDHGAEAIAVSHGLTILKLKERLTGQACFVQQIDPKVGKKLRGMLCGVDWRNGKLASVVSLP